MSTAGGAGARSGLASGMNSPTVRLDGLKYALATRSTSAVVSARQRSRCRKKSRQSPIAIELESAMPSRCGSLIVSSIPLSVLARTRSISPFVNGCCATSSITGSIAVRASVQRIAFRHLREEHREAGVVAVEDEVVDRGGFPGFDQRLVQATTGTDRHRADRGLDRDRVRVRARNGVIHRRQPLRVPHAAERHFARTVLHRLVGVQRRQHARRFRDRSEVFGDQRERLVRIERAGDDQHRVVRLVVQVIERLQAADVDALDVGARADRVLAVVVPVEPGRGRALDQHAHRIVLVALHFVAHDRHLAVQVLRRNTVELTMRSASMPSAQSRLASVAGNVSK